MDGVSSLMPHFARGGPWRRHRRKRSPRRRGAQRTSCCAVGLARGLPAHPGVWTGIYRVVGRRHTYVSRMRAVCMPRLLAHSPEDGMAGEGSVSLRYLA